MKDIPALIFMAHAWWNRILPKNMFLENKNKKPKTVHNLIQFPAYPLLSHMRWTIIPLYAIALTFVQCIPSQIVFTFLPHQMHINQTSYMVLTKSHLPQEVFPSHPKSEWFFPLLNTHTIVYTTHLTLCLTGVLWWLCFLYLFVERYTLCRQRHIPQHFVLCTQKVSLNNGGMNCHSILIQFLDLIAEIIINNNKKKTSRSSLCIIHNSHCK